MDSIAAFNESEGTLIPQIQDIRQSIGAYRLTKDHKREEAARENVPRTIKRDVFERFINALTTYAKEMPDSPLCITDGQQESLIRNLGVYHLWSCSKEVWQRSRAENARPVLTLGEKIIEVSIEPASEQKFLF